ncbi:hypothetical protein C0431_08915 [bacterium]|nr:hypothetical protein [bacterium]
MPKEQVSLEWTQEQDYEVKCTENATDLEQQQTLGIFCPINFGSSGPASVALSLRKIEGDIPRCFLLGISIYDDKEEREKTLSTLRFRKGGWSYLVESVYEGFLPPQRNEKTPWDYEVQWWRECGEIADCARARVDTIAKSGELARHQLFIPSFDDKELETTKGFAFFNNEDRVGDQPLVFLAVCFALHDRRCAKKNWSTTHNREVLDPRMFNRFTDPAIQASLLRACLHEELNYSGDQQLSSRFAQIIDSLIAGEGKGYAAALGEFCYAVLSEKVRLDGYVRGDVVSKIANLSAFESQWAKCFAAIAERQMQ